MYPEAGGSSSFARHAFNEFVSFFAAWAQMLNYVITVAISAFFVPHYIGGLFWEPLRSAPGDIIFAVGVIAVLSAINVVGIKESAGLNIVLALVDFGTQLLMVVVGALLVFSPQILVDNISFGVAPTWTDFLLAIPLGMIAYTGHRDDLEHGRGGQGRGGHDPEGDRPRANGGLRDLLHAAGHRAVGAAGDARPRVRRVPHAARRGGGGRRLRRRPDPRRRQAARPRLPAAARRAVRRAARRDDPADRDECRDHRRVAARLLDGHPPPGARPPAPAASEVRHAVGRDRRLRRRRVHHGAAWTGRLPRLHVRLRRDAVVHDRARGGHPPARSSIPIARGRTAARERCGSPGASCRARRSSAAPRRRCRSSS